jgi:hypothetical protein
MESPQGAEVKIAGVLITQSAVFDFSPLSPVGGPLKILLAKVVFGKRAKAGLKGGKVARFLEPV